MKTKVFYLTTKIIVAVILVAALVYKVSAAGVPEVKMVPYGNEKAIVTLSNNEKIVSVLTVENSSGDEVFYRKGLFDEKAYSKIFDFKYLEDGNYKIIVKNQFGESSVPFSVIDNVLVVTQSEEDVTPYMNIEDDILKISYLNENLSDVILSVYEGNDKIFNKTLGNNFSINSALSLARLERGEYSIALSNGKKTYYLDFSK